MNRLRNNLYAIFHVLAFNLLTKSSLGAGSASKHATENLFKTSSSASSTKLIEYRTEVGASENIIGTVALVEV